MDVSLPPNPSYQRACDQCRARKIRCSRGRPCVSCQASNLKCEVTRAKGEERRQRVLISNEYETKIDAIQSRLAGIEDVLQEVSASTRKLAGQTTPSSDTTALTKPRIGGFPASVASPPLQHFEGDSSFRAHLTATQNQLQDALNGLLSPNQEPDLYAAVKTLRRIVSEQTIYPESVQRSERREGATETHVQTLPPAEVVSRVMSDVKIFYGPLLCLFRPLRPYEEILSLCKEAYFDIEALPTTELIALNTTLFHVFKTYRSSFAPDDARQGDFESYHNLFTANITKLIFQLPLLLAPNIENLEAILMAAYHAVESSTPFLCSELVSKAVNICLTLGYHRIESMINDPSDVRSRKIHLFWFLYALDRSLCLRHGKSALLRDEDVTVSMPDFASPSESDFREYTLRFQIQLSRIQGRAYDDLYSPQALRQDYQLRAARSAALKSEIGTILALQDQRPCIPDLFNEAFDLFRSATKVALSTTLTTILCANQASVWRSHDCIEAARHALGFYIDCAIRYNSMLDKHIFADYLHWMLFQTPFTPILVIFCHLSWSHSPQDLELLANCLETLRSVRHLSSAIEKLFLICEVFHCVIKHLIKTGRKISPQATRTELNAAGPLGMDSDHFTPDNTIVDAFPPHGSASTTESHPMHQLNTFTSIEEYLNNDLFMNLFPNNSFI